MGCEDMATNAGTSTNLDDDVIEKTRTLCYGPPSPNADDVTTDTFVNRRSQKLFCRYWHPRGSSSSSPSSSESTPRGLVYISHGFSEHLGNYHSLGQALAARGLLAFGHDHAGHGKSDGKRAYIDSVDDFVLDMLDHCENVQEKYGRSLPLFLYAHSAGGMVAIRAAICFPAKFRGMTLVGPLVIPFGSLGPLDARVTYPRAFVVSWGLWLLDKLISPELVLGYPDYNLVSRDEGVIQLIKDDTLRWHGGCKVRLLSAFVACLRDNLSMLSQVKVAFKSFHGDSDGLCNVIGSRMLHQMASSEDKQLEEVPGGAHNLLLDIPKVRTRILSDIVQWIDQRVTIN